ncbi:MAG: hypothetical protein WDN72_06095 [Alphaproteobacteria bacterium]
MVADGDGGHVVRLGPRDDLGDFYRAFQQRIGAVHAQMDEAGH